MATGSSSTLAADFTIRRATPGDLPQLTALLERYYDEWSVIQRDDAGHIAAYLRKPSPFGFLIAEYDNILAACVLLRELASIPPAVECKRLYVLPEFRGHRLASRLMDAAEALAAQTLDWIYLDTGPDFTAAQSLYQRRGYESIERYNDNPQATFFFRKHLPA
jgi:ribosomal protein S18 acetylase RimI-like enzyme